MKSFQNGSKDAQDTEEQPPTKEKESMAEEQDENFVPT